MRLKNELLKETVTKLMEKYEFTNRFLAEKLFRFMGYKSPDGQLRDTLFQVRRGSVFGSTSARPRNPLRGLRNLSIILYALGVEEDHKLIAELREDNSSFEYPPENGISKNDLLKLRKESSEVDIDLDYLTAKLKQVDKGHYRRVNEFFDRLV